MPSIDREPIAQAKGHLSFGFNPPDPPAKSDEEISPSPASSVTEDYIAVDHHGVLAFAPTLDALVTEVER